MEKTKPLPKQSACNKLFAAGLAAQLLSVLEPSLSSRSGYLNAVVEYFVKKTVSIFFVKMYKHRICRYK